MLLTLDDVVFSRENWSLHASGRLGEGVHLVTGPVGSGKTTLALLTGRVIVPCSGNILFEDIGSVMLSQQFPEYHTTSATLAGEVSSWGLDPGKVLPDAGLSGRGSDDPFAISRGELKRLHLACVLAGDHDLLILDEPFSCLDCIGKKIVCDRIQERARGITLLFTHEQWILPRVRETMGDPGGKTGRARHGSRGDSLLEVSAPDNRGPCQGRKTPGEYQRGRSAGGSMQDPRIRLLATLVLSIASFRKHLVCSPGVSVVACILREAKDFREPNFSRRTIWHGSTRRTCNRAYRRTGAFIFHTSRSGRTSRFMGV